MPFNAASLKLHGGYTLLTLGYMAGIFLLSGTPAQDNGPIGLIPEFLQNGLHVPLFAGLTLCVFLSLSGGRWKQPAPFLLYGAVGLFACAYAALDEWHQSFVPGRFASVSDVFLDCVGIIGLLLVHRLNSLKSKRIAQDKKAKAEASSSKPYSTSYSLPDTEH